MANRLDTVIADAGTELGFPRGTFTHNRSFPRDGGHLGIYSAASWGEPITKRTLPYQWHPFYNPITIHTPDYCTMDFAMAVAAGQATWSGHWQAPELALDLTGTEDPPGLNPPGTHTMPHNRIGLVPRLNNYSSLAAPANDYPDVWMLRKGRWQLRFTYTQTGAFDVYLKAFPWNPGYSELVKAQILWSQTGRPGGELVEHEAEFDFFTNGFWVPFLEVTSVLAQLNGAAQAQSWATRLGV